MSFFPLRSRTPFGKAQSRRSRSRRVVEIKPRWKPPLPEVKDVFVFGGLGLAGVGIWQIYPPSALIVVGGIFFALGIYWYAGGQNGNP